MPDQTPDPNKGLAGRYPRAVASAEMVLDALLGMMGVGPETKANIGGQMIQAAVPVVGMPAAALRSAKAAKSAKSAATAADTALDLSHAARMQRAKEQGFDTSRTLYHGTGSDFRQFEPGRRSIYLTDKPELADIYANLAPQDIRRQANAGPNVMPVHVKAKKPLVVSDLGPDGGHGWNSDNIAAALGVENPGTGNALLDEARRQGYDLLEIRDMSDLGGKQTQFIPLSANNVRSVFAKFDPSKADSKDLLAALVMMAGGGMAAQQMGQK